VSTLRPAERERILEAVRTAEARTRAEFITVIAPVSDSYLTMPLLVASALALLVPGIGWLVEVSEDFAVLYAVQLAVFAAAVVALRWPPLTMLVVPPSAQEHRARRLALEQFLLRGLHATPERTGVLFFVSVAEHYVEIIADAGAHSAVTPGTWEAIVDVFTAKVRTGEVAAGYVAAITAVADALAEKLPRRPGDANLVADRLIEL
jgi:putative membrane protein